MTPPAADAHHLPGIRFIALDAELATEIAVLSRDEGSTLVTGFLRLARSAVRAAHQAQAAPRPRPAVPVG